jgi:hypothetical protein
MEDAQRPYSVFDAVAKHDLEGIIKEYVKNARATIFSYLSLRQRWSSTRPDPELKQGKSLFSVRVGAPYIFHGCFNGSSAFLKGRHDITYFD